MALTQDEANEINNLIERVNQLTAYVEWLDSELGYANSLATGRGFRMRLAAKWQKKRPIRFMDRTPVPAPRTNQFDMMDSYEKNVVTKSRKARPTIDEVISYDPDDNSWEDVM